MPACPVCEGPGMPLGKMGTRRHWRCRNCGMDWSAALVDATRQYLAGPDGTALIARVLAEEGPR